MVQRCAQRLVVSILPVLCLTFEMLVDVQWSSVVAGVGRALFSVTSSLPVALFSMYVPMAIGHGLTQASLAICIKQVTGKSAEESAWGAQELPIDCLLTRVPVITHTLYRSQAHSDTETSN